MTKGGIVVTTVLEDLTTVSEGGRVVITKGGIVVTTRVEYYRIRGWNS